MKKALVLIEGQYLFETFFNFGFPEKNIRWSKFLAHLLEPGDELAGARWYRPEKIQDVADRSANGMVLPDPVSAPVYRKVPVRSGADECWLLDKKWMFAEEENYYDHICRENTDITIVRKGCMKVNSYTRKDVGEKDVDMGLMEDMISAITGKEYDKIILVNGQRDCPGAVMRLAKDNRVRIHLVKIHKGSPGRNERAPVKSLRLMADKWINLYESQFLSEFLTISMIRTPAGYFQKHRNVQQLRMAAVAETPSTPGPSGRI